MIRFLGLLLPVLLLTSCGNTIETGDEPYDQGTNQDIESRFTLLWDTVCGNISQVEGRWDISPSAKGGAEKTPADGIAMISMGGAHSAAVMANGDLYIWGDNQAGQLGDSTVDTAFTPQPVPGLSSIKFVCLGSGNSAAIDENGDLYTWGGNSCGQLGIAEIGDVRHPVKVPGLSHVKYVSLGSTHSGAITEDGRLFTWGSNDCGQLGDGTTEDHDTPIEITSISNVKSIDFEDQRSAAITEDGRLYVWGDNTYGYLGDGTWENRLEPYLLDSIPRVQTVCLGGGTNAFVTEDGDVYTWGRDSLAREFTEMNGNLIPQKVPDLSDIKSVSVGYQRVGALSESGEVYVWGDYMFGGLGDGLEEGSRTPKKLITACERSPDRIGKLGLPKIQEMCWGGGHCGLLSTDGELFIFGSGSGAQIGQGTRGDEKLPLKITILSSGESENLDSSHQSEPPDLSAVEAERVTDFYFGDYIEAGLYGSAEEENLTLILSGTGNLDNMRSFHAGGSEPWIDINYLVVKNGIEEICDYSFYLCSNLKGVLLPDSLQSIWYNAFNGCSSLTEISIPPEVKFIWIAAFANCSNLQEIVLPDKVALIGSYAFKDCKSIRQATIPVSVGRIETGAFFGCSSLTDVYYAGSEDQWNAIEIDVEDNECLFDAVIHFNS